MNSAFDPRAWNLCAGLALVASGCGVRTIAAEESGTGTESESDSQTNESNETNEESSKPECEDNSDCPSYYYCVNGYCEYESYDDGHHGYECYDDIDCPPFELCVAYSCQNQPSPPACDGGAPPPAIPIDVQGQALGLTFADVDEDGADELIVATENNLEIHPSATDFVITPRGTPSAEVSAMVGGQFDPSVGEEVALLFDGTSLAVHINDGNGGLEPAEPTDIDLLSDGTGLLAANFGGPELDEVVVYGSAGAVVRVGGELFELSANTVHDMAYRPSSTDVGGVSALEPNQVSFIDLDAQPQDLVYLASGQARAQTSIVTFGEPMDLTARRVQDWTYLVSILPAASTPEPVDPLALPLRVATMEGVNFLEDMYTDVALIDEAGDLWVFRDAGYQPDRCLTPALLPNSAVELAVGDHDGNGDEEIAVLLANGEVVLFDL